MLLDSTAERRVLATLKQLPLLQEMLMHTCCNYDEMLSNAVLGRCMHSTVSKN